jgi:hypothetical protein
MTALPLRLAPTAGKPIRDHNSSSRRRWSVLGPRQETDAMALRGTALAANQHGS